MDTGNKNSDGVVKANIYNEDTGHVIATGYSSDGRGNTKKKEKEALEDAVAQLPAE